MKSLSELRRNFVEARELAQSGKSETVKTAAKKLFEIYKYCCEYHDLPNISIAERAQALALANKLEDVIRCMLQNGYQDEMVAEFLGYEIRNPGTATSLVSAPKSPSVKTAVTDSPTDISDHLRDGGGPVSGSPTTRTSSQIPTPTPMVTPIAKSFGGNWGADMFERYMPATVVITTDTACGTGFFISKNGYVLTNHHVVYSGNKKAQMLRITAGDETRSQSADILAADRTADVALLQISSQTGDTPFIPIIEDYTQVRPGDDVMIIGNAMNAGLAPVIGTIKFPGKTDMKNDIIYSAMTNGGDSGSPLIDREGRCVGIHKAREAEGEGPGGIRGIAYATNADTIKELLKKWSAEHKLDL